MCPTRTCSPTGRLPARCSHRRHVWLFRLKHLPAAANPFCGGWPTAAAAAVLLLAGNSWFDANPALSDFPIAEQQSATTVDWSRYEVTDEKEAFLVLRAALKTASTNLNEGPRITLKELKELDAILD
jgi:hypothetical protein